MVVAALAGALLGFFLAGSFSSSAPENIAVEPPPGGLADESVVVETVPPTTTSTVAEPETLQQLAPGFAGAIYLVTGAPGRTAVVHVWPSNAEAPRQTVTLPAGLDISTIAWDAGRSSVAALGTDPAGRMLLAGPVNNPDVVSPDATSFAWHTTRPRTIAWTEPVEGSRNAATLYTADFDDRRGTVIEVGPVTGRVASWGDWGFLLTRFDGGNQLVSLDLAGNERGTAAGGVAGPLNTSYQDSLLSTEPVDIGTTMPIVDPATATIAPLEGPTLGSLSVIVAPGLSQAAWAEQTGAREATLHIASLADGRPRLALPVRPARILDWTADGRFVLLESLISRIEDDSIFRPLYLVDSASGDVWEIPIDRFDLIGAAIRAA